MTADLRAERVLRATGLLGELNACGVLAAADVHVATRFGRLGGENDERVLLAAALAVRGTRQGAVVLRLAEVPSTVVDDTGAALSWPEPTGWLAAVTASPLVATADDQPGRPLRLHEGGLWLARGWREEETVATALLARAEQLPPVDPDRLAAALARRWPGTAPDDQRQAAAVCALSRVAVLAGGPGTGKTTTVARLLGTLQEAAAPTVLRVALTAPTGKAASRLQESVQAAAALEPAVAGLTATTLHRLLGARPGTTRTWHGAHRRLPHDVVVVDEASMVSLSLFTRLLEALRPEARLLLVGDPHQLASVEAGAVLADLVEPARDGARTARVAQLLGTVLPADPAAPPAAATPAAQVRDGVAVLTTVHRFDGGGAIDALATAVRTDQPAQALQVLRAGHAAVRFSPVQDEAPVAGAALEALRTSVLTQAAALVKAALAGDAETALKALEQHRLLCAHREGPRGIASWTRTVQRWVVEELGVQPRRDGRYVGLPLLVTSNDPDNKLWNGDSGVVLAEGEELVAVFGRGDGPLRVPLGRLGDVQPLHAMTVHRSQGSQFETATVLLPPASSPLGTRETLYTALTRASEVVHVIGSEQAVTAAVRRPAARATGLRERLA